MKKYRGAILAILLTAILWLVYFSHQLVEADKLNYGGDGFKNYYTLAYYLRHDCGSHFSGMNYPYGENVPFTDNQPALAWILKPFVIIFPSISDHIRLILISAIFLCVAFSALFTFKTLHQFDVGELPAVLFTALITMLSPQIQRLSGHYSLAYTCFLPIIIYLLVKFFQTNGKFKFFFWITATITFFSFIHIYYMAMAGMYILLIALFFSLSNLKNLKANFRFLALLVSSAIIPVVALKTYLLITDHIADRPTAPWGFIESRSTIPDILLHPNSFTGEVISNIFPKVPIVYHWEGLGYVGLITLITLFVSLIVGLFSIFKIKKLEKPLFQYPLNIFFPAAVIVLLFAMAFPFCIDSIEKYYDSMPGIIKQFRASGRFNWVFYYTATLTASVILYRTGSWLLAKKRILGYTFFLAIVSVWFVEANMVCNSYARGFKRWEMVMDEPKERSDFLIKLKAAGKNPPDFQAIFPLPFFLNGSEKIYITAWVEFGTMKASLITGLPIVCGEMSRTSLNQTLKIANLLSSDLLRKEVLKEYLNQKPLLLLAQGGFEPEEQKLINRAKFLFSIGDTKYYELPLSAFNDSTSKIKQYYATNRLTLFKHDQYLSTDSTNNVVIERFENEPKDYTVFGTGARYNPQGTIYFYFDTLPNAKNGTEYEFSIWFYSDKRTAAYPYITLSETDASGKEYGHYDCNGKFSTNTFGKWVRNQFTFTLLNHKDKICIAGNGNYATYDELMVRPKQVNVISAIVSDSSFNYNNFPIR